MNEDKLDASKHSNVSIIIPAFNEQDGIVATLENLRRYFPAAEIIVVDNASPDGSAKLLAGEPGLQLIANEINLGWDFYTYAHDYLGHAGDHKPSMLVDVEQKRRTEIDFLNGKIVEYGQRVNIPTPSHGTIRSLVKARELN